MNYIVHRRQAPSKAKTEALLLRLYIQIFNHPRPQLVQDSALAESLRRQFFLSFAKACILAFGND
jgi:hypothetical protein